MTIADRIQLLRKTRGISQEELSDQLGVSRQAVSKWESEQSVPDLDKVIRLSEFFEVTTDYLLKGIENEKTAPKQGPDARIFAVVATVLNLIGLLLGAAVWYREQSPMAVVIGLVFMALGCMVFGVGMYGADGAAKGRAKYNFWSANVWILSFIPLACVHNTYWYGGIGPYPSAAPPVNLLLFWGVYGAICLAATLFLLKRRKKC